MGNWFWMGGFAASQLRRISVPMIPTQHFKSNLFSKGFVHLFPCHWHNLMWSTPICGQRDPLAGWLESCFSLQWCFSSSQSSARTLPGISRTPQNSCLALEWKFPSWHFSWECPGRQLVAHSNKTTKHLLVEHESKTLSPFSKSWDCSLFVKGALVLRKVLSHCPQDRDVWWKMKCDEYD